MTKIFVDIETLPGPVMPGLDKIEAPKNYKNPEKIRIYKVENQEKLWRKEALTSHKGIILCIGFAFGDGEVECLYNGAPDEQEIMIELDSRLKYIADNLVWIGKSTAFDCLFLYQRAVKYRCLNILDHLNPVLKLRHNIIDITNLFGQWLDYRYMVSLDDMAAFFGLESSKSIMTGAHVFSNWQAGNHKMIQQYNKADVELTRQLYNLLKF